MTLIKTYAMANSAIIKLNFLADKIDVDPPYQRNSEIWDLEKRQLLIDSILNGFDIPKIYFHLLNPPRKLNNGKEATYAIIDGKQRMETIFQFMTDRFPLADDFRYCDNPNIKPAGMKYSEIAKKYTELKVTFDGCVLPVIIVETNDIELIEEMFSRLNEAVPLSSAEKRNALGGPIPKLINEIASHSFFVTKVSFSNKRYQHREAAAKLLFLENTIHYQRRIVDTKRAFLDAFVREYKKKHAQQKLIKIEPSSLRDAVKDRLDQLNAIFFDNDPLLSQQGIVVIYYLLMRLANQRNKANVITRNKLEEFNKSVAENKEIAEKDISKANFNLLQFDKLSMQGSNDASSIKVRLRILSSYFGLIEHNKK